MKPPSCFLSKLYEKTGELDAALENLQKLLDLKPSYSNEVKNRIEDIKKRSEDEKMKTKFKITDKP